MGYMDKTLKQTVPYYSTMKRAGAFRQPQKPQKRQKRTTLTEYSRIEAARYRQSSSKEAV